MLYINDENRNELNEEYYRRVIGDLALAERRLKEELGNIDSAIAFPYGSFNDRLLEASNSIGIDLKFSIREGLCSRMTPVAPRINKGDSTLSPDQFIESLKHAEPMMEMTINSSMVPLAWTQPQLRDGILLVPLSPLCKALGVEMDYDPDTRTLKLTPGSLSTDGVTLK